ncbi:hybrid sensor histidine kinase/response regulator [Geminisphaera colitermitum]|uniref:hybrid sensor histidine kinase/response regulator n=1 Tax=Geminisphaera colitermitum TaxID=1148786 RepID=UPI000158D254|nr:PAS domain S-box protein [Geminisphaera colitermitum]
MSKSLGYMAAGIPGSDEETDPWVEPWADSLELAVVHDIEERVLAANSAFARKLGRRISDCSGLVLGDLVHADDVAGWRQAATRINAAPYHIVREHRWHTAQGWRWISWEETLLRDAGGHPLGVRSIGRDVTRRRLGEEHFSKLAQAVEQAPISIVMTTPEGRVQYVNPRFTQVTGYTLEEVFERDIRVLREGHPTEEAYRQFGETVAAGRQWRGELHTSYKGNPDVWENVLVSPIRNHADELTHLLCLRVDITERKHLEEQLRQSQKMESLGTLVGGIAHDFNNLLAIIKGFIELSLTQGPADETLQRYLREAYNAAQRSIGLVRQILTFSRKAEVSYSLINLNQLIGEHVQMLAETFPRTIEFRQQLDPALPTFAADPNQLQQVLMNLCVNARDAMPDGGALTLATRRVPGSELAVLRADEKQDYVEITVADTGTGMTPEVREHIFEPFFTTKQARAGTGLGLAVVYGVVVNHQGLFDVDTAPGEGTKFRIYLPLATRSPVLPDDAGHASIIQTADGRAAQNAKADGAGGKPGRAGGENILVVEDEASLRMLLGTLLEEQGYTVHLALDGAEAVQAVEDHALPIDAVLLDLNLPRVHGIDVFKTIRRERPTTKVIVLSGRLMPETRQKLREIGPVEFLDKPCDLGVLSRRLRSLLDGETVL